MKFFSHYNMETSSIWLKSSVYKTFFLVNLVYNVPFLVPSKINRLADLTG